MAGLAFIGSIGYEFVVLLAFLPLGITLLITGFILKKRSLKAVGTVLLAFFVLAIGYVIFNVVKASQSMQGEGAYKDGKNMANG